MSLLVPVLCSMEVFSFQHERLLKFQHNMALGRQREALHLSHRETEMLRHRGIPEARCRMTGEEW